ncbi:MULTISPECIES: tetratricopeptide repeat protein [Deinococcus]|uniref:Uncharacterized protein n=1 Tax=Deinococcus cavernae TaxID=2320857 RepID=A0A418UZU5_9DEIO|nr:MULTISPECIES: tetratricopeptide repeat protein [Deinococcus]RJF68988.1 hypothetical protein D3875_21910 [Deinococcus cavernae]
MIDVDTTWQQVSEALAGDDYDAAFGILDAAMREADPRTRARLALYQASLHALYGEAGVTDMQRSLAAARGLDASLAADPLYLALHAELQARTTGIVSVPADLLTEEAPPLARYHALGALALSGQASGALDVFLPVTDVPEHLRWRLRSWQADSHEANGQTQEAAHLYGEAAHHARGLNRAVMLQEQAALLLQLGQLDAVRQALNAARPEYTGRDPDEGLNLATWHYLNAQALLQQGNPEDALREIEEAARLERHHGDMSYGVALVRGQVFSHLGRPEEALRAFEESLALATEPDRPYAQHELGVALLDLDRPLEARERLEAAAGEADYPYQPEVLADIAECDYRLGRLAEAQLEAEQALAGGAVVPASLVLGSIAMDYYHLDEALDHYERVVRESAPDTRDWVTGHQMAADIMAQQGFRDPAAAYAHAQQALEHTPESDDWHGTLQEYVRKAEALLGQGSRTLN